MNLLTEVVVLSGNMISVDAPEVVMRNVPYPIEGYGFIVKLRFVKSRLAILLNYKDCYIY